MKDKFVEYYSSEEKIQEMSQYVHENFKLINTKMLSEMGRKLDISPDFQNSEGYLSLMVSLHGRMFNEMVYCLAGMCQSTNMKITDILPPHTILMFLDMLKGINPLKGSMRTDVQYDRESFAKYYRDEIDSLRKHLEALPK